MILVDQNEPAEIQSYLSQHVEVQVGNYNQSPNQSLIYPDYTIVGGPHLIGVNRKQVGEVLSSLDSVEEQLQRELTGPCEYLALVVEGVMLHDSGMGSWAYTLEWNASKLFNNLVGTLPFKRQHSNQNYIAVRNKLNSLQALGIQVTQTYSMQDTAIALIALHNWAMKPTEEHQTLNRLIKTKHTVQCLPEERQFALTLMGIEGGGCGEELALTLAQSFSNIKELLDYWSDGGTIQDTMMRNGTRRIGKVAEQRLQKALGFNV